MGIGEQFEFEKTGRILPEKWEKEDVFICPICKSKGWTPSKSKFGGCTFCDGTAGGVNE